MGWLWARLRARSISSRRPAQRSKAALNSLYAKVPAGGRLLLCSDGLHDLLPEDEIESLAKLPDIDEAAQLLVARANTRGGFDNVTVLLVEP